MKSLLKNNILQDKSEIMENVKRTIDGDLCDW